MFWMRVTSKKGAAFRWTTLKDYLEHQKENSCEIPYGDDGKFSSWSPWPNIFLGKKIALWVLVWRPLLTRGCRTEYPRKRWRPGTIWRNFTISSSTQQGHKDHPQLLQSRKTALLVRKFSKVFGFQYFYILLPTPLHTSTIFYCNHCNAFPCSWVCRGWDHIRNWDHGFWGC